MKPVFKLLCFAIGMSLLFLGCSGAKKESMDSAERFKTLTSLEKSFRKMNRSDENFNSSRKELMGAYKAFAKHFPKHDKSPGVLYNLSIEYAASDSLHQSMQILQNIIDTYPDHRVIPYAKFNLANIMSERYNHMEKAKELWNDIIRDWPESQQAQQSKQMLLISDTDADRALEKILEEKDSE